ncbi:DUF1853 family protein [Changchengzhania lutea]|uniref:DUF1853 family protein n=1 Tax=Changchengzhania lutea TaxID=2049305 RepID=UPI00115F36DD|nr:DUF1853 family protein [Changchengzhania lutea]
MIQKRYEGFLKTPYLWKHNVTFDLQQFEIISKLHKIDSAIDDSLRLGKYVERLVSFELEQHDAISIIAENIQIQDNKTTLGELDCLLIKDNKPIHLEIIYKFYLYDDSVGTTEIEHIIGPNRKDSLKEKLTKLSKKQLPLLHADATGKYLTKLGLKPKDITQEVYFKAQLFVPYANNNIELKILNPECIVGFYMNRKELEQFKDCEFYIPNKKDWLALPHQHVNWMNFGAFKNTAKDYFEQQFSPLCWIKSKNWEMTKIFLVWW